jgi:DNA invertase Pin-like site-specific DNA recombinase
MLSAQLKCGIYVRGQHKDSVNLQLDVCNKFINGKSMEVVGEFVDLDKDIREKSSFSTLMEKVKLGKVNCIVYYDESRLSRSVSELFEKIISPLIRFNPELKFINALTGRELK